MAAITASMVKDLRETTGAGMMDCKKALTETDGNFEAAIEFLKKKGLAAAAKKASRIAAEGICLASTREDGKRAAVVEVNSETDFVAKNEKFRTYVQRVADQALVSSAADIDAFLAEAWIDDSSKTVAEELSSQIAIIGENMHIRRKAVLEAAAGFVETYIHMGGKIGVLIELEGADNAETRECAKNVAMQIAAMKPQYISRADIPQSEVEKLKEITIESSINAPDTLPKPILMDLINKAVSEKLWSEEDLKTYEEQKNNMQYLFNFLSAEAKPVLAGIAMGKKDEILANKMFSGAVEGRVSKQIKEISLMEQPYVKDDSMTVAKYVESVAKQCGGLTVKNFVRFETGEGLEKKNEDFAAEVAKQMGN